MVRRGVASLVGVLTLATLAPAQAPQLHWQNGQTLVYKVEQVSVAVEAVGDAKAETTNRLNLVKRWQVVGLDGGVATVQLSLQALRLEIVRPGGDSLLYDSAAPEKSAAPLRDQLSKFVGPPLAVLRVDGSGRVLEVKKSEFGPASRFESELPFGGLLPAALPQVGQTWERPYNITLEPPQGTGEKIPAVQRYACKAVDAGTLTVSVKTELKDPPKASEDLVPLLQSLPEGELVFDLQAGRLQKWSYRIEKELSTNLGEGATYSFTGNYTETYVGDR